MTMITVSGEQGAIMIHPTSQSHASTAVLSPLEAHHSRSNPGPGAVISHYERLE